MSAGFSQISDAIRAGRLRESLSFLGGIRNTGVNTSLYLYSLHAALHPLEWILLLTVVFNIVATPELLVIEDFLQIILSGILFAWLAVRLINAISVRGVAGLADDTVELRLRSLRLVAGWVLILSLGLTLTKTYAGQGTTYAAVWMLFEFLSIPVIVLLLT